MNECYCTECDWEGNWDTAMINDNGESACPMCESKFLEAIYEDHDDDEDDFDDNERVDPFDDDDNFDDDDEEDDY